jgi:hypothetical protein
MLRSFYLQFAVCENASSKRSCEPVIGFSFNLGLVFLTKVKLEGGVVAEGGAACVGSARASTCPSCTPLASTSHRRLYTLQACS